MSRKYSEKPVNVTVEAEESQLDRVERKVDKLLNLVGDKGLVFHEGLGISTFKNQ